ncbi:RNA-guided endonuclease TnpB family protein [Actinomadura sp. BRA 177]|uniref:RNA-guided endonuclease InsQ/TnpB family protein n=1 Tax=Actinomadura sp. BRA 177 TaxID=2745202 RepID=UPI001595853D|nr:RNA-guided endonuclease TnpB family protein [Actinomadura sp. BRA 177]NVI90233.1 IS200/IS605 family element transposase accessory protein TnpB [Actinomadura sp. BRA 177]
MKLVVQVKLLPDAAADAALRETLKLCNQAAGHASRRAHATGVKGKTALQRLVYGELKAMGLSAQPAIHCVRKVAGAYATLAENLKAGNYGPQGSRRRARVEGEPVRFRKDAAQPFDDRSLSWQIQERTVSVWTVRGRLKNIAFACSAEHAAVLAAHRRGESDLVWRGGCFYLYATCDVPQAPEYVPDKFTGVDLGIVNIATTSDGTVHSGKRINQVRHRNRRLRRRLQRKGTKSAKRLLRHLSGREARFAADTNHRISKQIVTEAQRTTHGIALEDLGGIRARVRLRKPQRVTLHSWSFAQLGAFITYKAQRAGVPVVFVDPRHTSQGCSVCGHIHRKNRPDQATFRCTSCGFAEHADVNAARNIAARGAAGWAVSHAADDAA